MKTRKGFVSNSSSSSFLCINDTIYGIQLPCDRFKKFLSDNKHLLKKDSDIKEYVENSTQEDAYLYVDEAICEMSYDGDTGMDSIFGEYNLDIYYEEYGCKVFIGVPLYEIRDDQTYGEFKQKVKSDLCKILGEEAVGDIECNIHSPYIDC